MSNCQSKDHLSAKGGHLAMGVLLACFSPGAPIWSMCPKEGNGWSWSPQEIHSVYTWGNWGWECEWADVTWIQTVWLFPLIALPRSDIGIASGNIVGTTGTSGENSIVLTLPFLLDALMDQSSNNTYGGGQSHFCSSSLSDKQTFSAIWGKPVSLEFTFHFRFLIQSNEPQVEYIVNSTEAQVSPLTITY